MNRLLLIAFCVLCIIVGPIILAEHNKDKTPTLGESTRYGKVIGVLKWHDGLTRLYVCDTNDQVQMYDFK